MVRRRRYARDEAPARRDGMGERTRWVFRPAGSVVGVAAPPYVAADVVHAVQAVLIDLSHDAAESRSIAQRLRAFSAGEQPPDDDVVAATESEALLSAADRRDLVVVRAEYDTHWDITVPTLLMADVLDDYADWVDGDSVAVEDGPTEATEEPGRPRSPVVADSAATGRGSRGHRSGWVFRTEAAGGCSYPEPTPFPDLVRAIAALLAGLGEPAAAAAESARLAARTLASYQDQSGTDQPDVVLRLATGTLLPQPFTRAWLRLQVGSREEAAPVSTEGMTNVFLDYADWADGRLDGVG